MAAPSSAQVAGNEVKNLPADVTTNRQPTHDTVEATQATDKVVPDASGDKSTSVSNEVDTAPTQETTPTKAVPESEHAEDPAPHPPSRNASAPPPVPEKETAVPNKPPLTADETSASPSQAAEPAPTKVEGDANKTEEPSVQPTEQAPATENADSLKLEVVEEGPKPQSGVEGDNSAVDEGSATQDGDGKPNGGTKLTLHTDRVREMSTASIMTASSSTPGTPAEEVASSAVDEESGAPGRAGPLSRSQKKKLKKKLKKGEKNSPHTPSAETLRNMDNSTIQNHKPPVVATPAPADIPGGEGDGELVEKDPCGEEDSPVIVDRVDNEGKDPAVKVEPPLGETGKAVDASGDSSTDEWMDFNMD